MDKGFSKTTETDNGLNTSETANTRIPTRALGEHCPANFTTTINEKTANRSVPEKEIHHINATTKHFMVSRHVKHNIMRETSCPGAGYFGSSHLDTTNSSHAVRRVRVKPATRSTAHREDPTR